MKNRVKGRGNFIFSNTRIAVFFPFSTNGREWKMEERKMEERKPGKREEGKKVNYSHRNKWVPEVNCQVLLYEIVLA